MEPLHNSILTVRATMRQNPLPYAPSVKRKGEREGVAVPAVPYAFFTLPPAVLLEDTSKSGRRRWRPNPHGDDHSVFIAFAPVENPKIALIVYVEKGVWGSRYAAPIAGLLIEKYLKGKISDKKKPLEKEMFEASLIDIIPNKVKEESNE